LRPKYLIGLTLAVLVFVTCVSLVLVFVTTRGRDSTEDQLIEGLRPYQEQLAFEIIVPSYLPTGTSRTPTEVSVDGQDVEFFLRVVEEGEHYPWELADVYVRQARLEKEECGNQGFVSSRETVDIAGERAYVLRFSTGDPVILGYTAELSGICMTVQFAWHSRDLSHIELSPEMEREATRGFESMVENSRE